MAIFRSCCNSKLFFAIFAVFLCVLNHKAYSSTKAIGDIRAVVVEKVVIGGVDSHHEFGMGDFSKPSTASQGRGYFYEGSVIYDMQSEPNSEITVYYQSGDNNSSLIKKSESINNIVKVSFEYNSKSLVFDESGNAELKINPIFFIGNKSYDNNYKAIYYVTLLY